jgi:erythronate-4-phosphate dehydrogenase
MPELKILADGNMAGVEPLFSALGEVRLKEGRSIDAADLQDIDILLVRSVTRVNQTLLGGDGENGALRFVGSATSGVDHIDRGLLGARGIDFAHAPGSNANSVLEYVFSVISQCPGTGEQLFNGACLGIIGYGHIGKALAARCTALGIAWRAYDPWLDSQEHGLSPLEQVLECAVVCLHAELTDREPWPSRHLLGDAELATLSPETLLINAGRGELVDNAALLHYLEGSAAAQVVLDVWEGEPELRPGLLQRCLFGSAHIAGYSYDGKLLATRMLYDAACAALGIEVSASALEHGAVGEPEDLSLQVPAGLSDAQLLRWLQQQSYDVREDDALLRASPGDFDGLRKRYRRRRELAAFRVANPQVLSDRQRQICAALGLPG